MKLNGKLVADFKTIKSEIKPELYAFLEEWFNDEADVVGHTSGSTGQPKEIRLSKEDMRASARITNEFFGIGEESVLLLCLSVSYIAGKMMVVRALEADAELWTVEVSSHPLRELVDKKNTDLQKRKLNKKIDLAAMVPLQVEETLKVIDERVILSDIRHVIIGGAPVSARLEKQLEDIPALCYVTYGMTETVSHVALRKINSHTAYMAIGKVRFDVDERGCLVIHAPHLYTKEFVTNDLVKLIDDQQFEWLGRWDHVINSGGIKFSPEVLENKIADCLEQRFFITSVPDDRLGERIVIVIEGEIQNEQYAKQLFTKLRQVLMVYEMPKEIRYLHRFQETNSGKVIRRLE